MLSEIATAVSSSHVLVAAGGTAVAAAEIGAGQLRAPAFVLGAVASEAVAAALKHIVQQPRPPGAPAECLRSGVHGMPSSHTLLLCYAVAALAARGKPLRNVLLVLWAAAVAWARVATGCHTSGQVLAGGALGLAFGLLWRSLSARLIAALQRHRLPTLPELGFLSRFFLPRGDVLAVALLVSAPAAMCGALVAWDPKAVLRIVLYDGSARDVLINYSVLVLTFATALLSPISEIVSRYRGAPLAPFALEPVMWLLTAFQIIMCYVLSYVGISIVWNALLPFAFVPAFNSTTHLLPWLACISAILADIHYFLTTELIETVSHISAIVLGCVIILIQCSIATHFTTPKARQAKKHH